MFQTRRRTRLYAAARLAIFALLSGVVSLSVSSEKEVVCPEGKGEACCDLDWTGQGATIVKMGGEVMVSQSPWVNASVGARINNGGRVMTLEKSFAVVAYDDGCWHEMGPNELLTIEDVSPCCAAAIPPTPPPAVVPLSQAWVPPAAAVVIGIIGAIVDGDEEPPPPISR